MFLVCLLLLLAGWPYFYYRTVDLTIDLAGQPYLCFKAFLATSLMIDLAIDDIVLIALKIAISLLG